MFENNGLALIVLEPKAGGVPVVNGLEQPSLEPPLMPTDQISAVSQQAKILERLGFDQKSAVLVIPYRPDKVTLGVPQYFETWSNEEKNSWHRQMEANFLRQQQAMLGFPRPGHTPFAPPGYEHLMQPLSMFLKDHPNYQRNIFLMTRFAEHEILNKAIQFVRSFLEEEGHMGLKPDDKTYHVGDRVLWNNVCTYMIGGSRGIAILEDTVRSDFNPNIAIEYGFMRALNKPVLILADRNFRRISADVMGILYERFDLTNPEMSKTALAKWLKESTVASA